MQVTLLDATQARDMLRQILGGELDSREGISDLIRHEVSARVRGPRHFVIARVCRLTAPVVSLDPKLVGDVCDELELEGDVLLADGGVLHPAPIRIVALGSSDYRFVCAVPSVQLFSAVPAPWVQRRSRRSCRLSQPIEPIASALGAIVVTPEVWAGLDRAPCADAEWVRGLDQRLSWAPEPAGSLERDEVLEWTGYDLSQGEPRWMSQCPASLWRARHRWRRWVYAWAPGGNPSKSPFVSLYPDEGARTTFALARSAGSSLRASVTWTGDSTKIEVPGWLPLAEYRYLSTCAERVEGEGRRSVWAVPASRRQAVLAVLTARLGLCFDEESA